MQAEQQATFETFFHVDIPCSFLTTSQDIIVYCYIKDSQNATYLGGSGINLPQQIQIPKVYKLQRIENLNLYN